MRLDDAVVVVTGASSGIGRATALEFAEHGATVVVAARRERALESVVEQCRAVGGDALAAGVDMIDPKAVDELASRAVQRFGRIDVWVNNASVTMFAPFLRTPPADLRRLVEVNLFGYLYGARAALAQMRAQGHGVLVNVSSVVGQVPQPYTSAYGLTKAAVSALGMSLRQELILDRLTGVKVCTVFPATIDTPLFRHAANYTGREPVPMPPVYPPATAARAIVRVARRPRRELTAGRAARLLVLFRTLLPSLTERVYARQVDKTQLSREQPAPDTTGNLFGPSDDPRTAGTTGGWGGTRRAVQRNLVAGTLAAAVAFALWRKFGYGQRGEWMRGSAG